MVRAKAAADRKIVISSFLFKKRCYNSQVGKKVSGSFFNGPDSYGDVAQLGERSVRNAEVAGSNPVVSTVMRIRINIGVVE